MKFEWHGRKATANFTKHEVSFEEAATVFADELALSGSDPDHSLEEHRYVIFGRSAAGRVLVVAYTERGERIRLISARQATRSERVLYEKG